MSGHKIIDGLKDAVAGNFDRVTIEGHVWVRRDAEVERLRAALEECEQLAGRLGPPNEIDACNEIERVAKAALSPHKEPGAV